MNKMNRIIEQKIEEKIEENLELLIQEETSVKEVIDEISKSIRLPDNVSKLNDAHLNRIKQAICILKSIKEDVSKSVISFRVEREIEVVRG